MAQKLQRTFSTRNVADLEVPVREQEPVSEVKLDLAQPQIKKRPSDIHLDSHGHGMKALLLTSMNALGIVYGDIGTSPLYVFKSTFDSPPSEADVLGSLSLIVYCLLLIVCVKYLVFVMRADNRAVRDLKRSGSSSQKPPTESGRASYNTDTIPRNLKPSMVKSKQAELQSPSPEQQRNRSLSLPQAKTNPNAPPTILSNPRVRTAYILLSLLGAGALLGDGTITPAISVLSALEGLEVTGDTLSSLAVPMTCVVLFSLFMVQRFGTSSVGMCFGPVMLLWFFCLGSTGIYNITAHPDIFEALNPYHAIAFFINNGGTAWVKLGSLVLCVTGCEAMYADMGHFGKAPIRLSWLLVVYPCLLLNYLGQGALLITQPSTIDDPFFESIPSGLFWPVLVLSTMATVIASQALISGAFSLCQQAVSLNFFPKMNIIHTNDAMEGQIYVPVVNYTLMVGSIALVLAFKTSAALANVYGLAVCVDMLLTSIFFLSLARIHWKWHIVPFTLLAIEMLIVDLMLFSSNLLKIPHGGWFPLVVAIVLFTVMVTWLHGKHDLDGQIKSQQITVTNMFNQMKAIGVMRCTGTAVFLSPTPKGVPAVLVHFLGLVPVVHEKVIFLTVQFKHVPYVDDKQIVVVDLHNGFYRVIAKFGYMQSDMGITDILLQAAKSIPQLDMTDVSYFYAKEKVTDKSEHWIGRRYQIKLFNILLQISTTSELNFKTTNSVSLGIEYFL